MEVKMAAGAFGRARNYGNFNGLGKCLQDLNLLTHGVIIELSVVSSVNWTHSDVLWIDDSRNDNMLSTLHMETSFVLSDEMCLRMFHLIVFRWIYWHLLQDTTVEDQPYLESLNSFNSISTAFPRKLRSICCRETLANSAIRCSLRAPSSCYMAKLDLPQSRVLWLRCW